jgi:catechol 2,3-dioxygenase-like lactoylglutathione lyase family enzyme
LAGGATTRLTRRQVLAGALLAAAGNAKAAPGAVPVAALDHVNIHVRDVKKSADFYAKLFGTVVSRTASAPVKPGSPRSEIWFLRMGENFLAISSVAPGEKPGLDHFCFAVDGFDGKTLRPKLAELGDAWPDLPPTNLWLKDPDGYVIQITPGDKGPVPGASVGAVLVDPADGAPRKPPFQVKSIASLRLPVADGEKSRAYYQKLLGDATAGPNNFPAGRSRLILQALLGEIQLQFSVAGFEANAVSVKLQGLGLSPMINHDAGLVLFPDPDGLGVAISA